MSKKLIYLLLFSCLLLDTSYAMAIEEPKFTVLTSRDGVEYRQYEAYMVAATLIAGENDRDTASSQGFRRLFKYISGDNTPNKSISMTAPVQQTPSANGWKIAFIVPQQFSQDTVPTPASADVAIETVPAQLMAVVRYSGRWTDKNLKQHADELLQKLEAAGIPTRGPVMSAAYNAPFTPPFMRRNEVMVVVDRVP